MWINGRLRSEKKKEKQSSCVVCMVLYLIVALAICASYAARGGTAGNLKYKVLIKAARDCYTESSSMDLKACRILRLE